MTTKQTIKLRSMSERPEDKHIFILKKQLKFADLVFFSKGCNAIENWYDFQKNSFCIGWIYAEDLRFSIPDNLIAEMRGVDFKIEVNND